MSGYSDFTWWIHSKAECLIYKGNREKIKTTFFTSGDGMHNSDEFNIKLKNGKVVGCDDKDVDWKDLHNRYYNSLSSEEKKKVDDDAKELREHLNGLYSRRKNK